MTAGVMLSPRAFNYDVTLILIPPNSTRMISFDPSLDTSEQSKC